MVFIKSFLGVAAIFAGVSAAPRPDSALGEEVGVSAPNGIVMSDTAALASRTQTQSASATGMSMGGDMNNNYGGNMGGNYGGNNNMGGSYGGDKNMGGNYGGNMGGGNMGGSYGGNMGGGNMGGNYGGMTTSTMMATSTSTSQMSYQTQSMQYGSGSSNWGGSGGYDNCVSQCVASYGAPPAMWTPSPTQSMGGSGNGATHTVIVAPSQGVLRYVPFAVNASVGDTILFMWRANNHTVTKSSELELCNKTSNAPFVSGTHDKDFTFTQVVNDTSPTFYYCGTPGHCQNGMFGIINPPSALGSPSSVSGMMSSMVQNNSDLAAIQSYTTKQCAGNAKAGMWGGNIDMKTMPGWSNSYLAENVMYTRTFLAANPDVMNADGTVDLGRVQGPLAFPQDLKAALQAAGGSVAAASAPAYGSASASASKSAAPSASAKSGAASIASSSLAVAVVAGIAAFLSL